MQYKSVQDFLNHVQAELDANRLVLPTLPSVAIKVRNAVANGDATAQDLADIILTDAALSVRLIQVANSPLYCGSVKINNIPMAVTRLGNKTTRTLVTALVMQQMFAPTTQVLEKYFKEIWEHSTNVSAMSRVLASFVSNLDPDEAMLAGLIHQIGKLPILALVENIPEFRDNSSRLDKLLEKAHPQIGKLIMDSWDFPDNLKVITSEYINFKHDSGKETDYIDVVQVAFLQTIVGTNHPACKIDWADVPSFAKLGLAAEEEILEIEGISEEVELAHAMLAA